MMGHGRPMQHNKTRLVHPEEFQGRKFGRAKNKPGNRVVSNPHPLAHFGEHVMEDFIKN